jgi:DNA-directed RNA polymerase specialized sigma24 family protein
MQTISVSSIRFVKELYPRIKPNDEAIERYRDALEKLPPIVVARDGVLVDGYHRWQAHVREEVETIQAEDLGNLSDAEILREAIVRNAAHGQQLSRADKQREAGRLWKAFEHLEPAAREQDIAELLAVSDRTVRGWTKDARKEEKQALQEKVWQLHLSCLSQRQISDATGVPVQTLNGWLSDFGSSAIFGQPPGATPSQPWGNVQHFDVWSFQSNDRDGGGQQSYFGACPPQVMENLLWLYTEPGKSIVVDLFAGSGTTLEVAHRMGRRAWVSDIRGNHYSPHLDIHQHDATTGWPSSAPTKTDLLFLDPPYWKQAAGRYSSEPNELAEMTLQDFNAAWVKLLKDCRSHLNEGGKLAYIISPTEDKDAGVVVDHAMEMVAAALSNGYRIHRRMIVTYQTQQATGQQVTWARENRRLLKLYRDLVVLEVVK